MSAAAAAGASGRRLPLPARDQGRPRPAAVALAMVDGGGDRELLNLLYRVRKTACEMLEARDYLLERKEVDMTKDEFEEKFGATPMREGLTCFAKKKNDPTEQIFVFFPDDAKVRAKGAEEPTHSSRTAAAHPVACLWGGARARP